MANVKWTWSGGQGGTSVRVTASINGAATSCRLVASLHASFSSPTYSAPAAVDANGYCKMEVGGLTPNTRWYYGVEIDGTIDPAWTGRVRTLPKDGLPANFKVLFGSCSGTLSQAPIWQRMASRDPLMLIHAGDLGYFNISTNDQVAFRAQYEARMACLPQQQAFRDLAVAYMWDNHDFGDPSGSGSDASKPAVSAVYRQIVPSYDVTAADGIYHDFRVGRVPFIVTDQRSNLTPPGVNSSSSSVLGATQLAWFKAKLLAYKAAGAPVIFWVSEKSWYATGAESWSGGYTTERDAIAVFIAANGIPPVICLSGDQHFSAYNAGAALSAGAYAMPEHCASPIDQTSTTLEDTASPWTSGPWRNQRGNNQYLMLDLYDDGTNCYWQITGWQSSNPDAPDYNLYAVDSRTPTDAPQLKLAYTRWKQGSSWGPTGVKDGPSGIERPVYTR